MLIESLQFTTQHQKEIILTNAKNILTTINVLKNTRWSNIEIGIETNLRKIMRITETLISDTMSRMAGDRIGNKKSSVRITGTTSKLRKGTMRTINIRAKSRITTSKEIKLSTKLEFLNLRMISKNSLGQKDARKLLKIRMNTSRKLINSNPKRLISTILTMITCSQKNKFNRRKSMAGG